ncbi:MAG: thiamine phosphate synthase [Devosia sp.]
MDLQFFLIAPPGAEPAQFLDPLRAALAAVPVAALLLPRGDLSDNAYKALAKAVVPVAQGLGAAVLVEGDPGLVRLTGADGLHVSGSVSEVKAAVSALKPNYIVGAGSIESRHDAMSKGELGPDYLFFGSVTGARPPEHREMARWWAELFEVPAVFADPLANADTATSEGAEFVGLGESVWSAPEGPAARLKAIAAALKVPA